MVREASQLPLEPETLTRERLLVDIRPEAERYGELGFIPTSICVSCGPNAEHIPERLRELAQRSPLTLYCLSGRRTGLVLDVFAEEGLVCDVDHLSGGLLAWRAQGCPTVDWTEAEFDEDLPIPFSSTEDAVQAILSCFVGELTETILDQGLPISEATNPVTLLDRCFHRAGVPRTREPAVSELLKVLDCAAMTSLQMGTALERVASNLSLFIAALGHLPEHAPISVAP